MSKRRKPYRYKLRYKLVFWSLVLMLLFSAATLFMNKPSEGTVVKHSLQDSPGEVAPAKTNTITGKYFNLLYDASLDTVSNISQTDNTALEVYRVARSDISGRRIFVVTIKQLPSGGMSEESSYKFRRINPKLYREGSAEYGGQQFVTFEKADGSELTAFISKGGKLAMLAYTLQAPDGELHEEAAKLLENFSWQL